MREIESEEVLGRESEDGRNEFLRAGAVLADLSADIVRNDSHKTVGW